MLDPSGRCVLAMLAQMIGDSYERVAAPRDTAQVEHGRHERLAMRWNGGSARTCGAGHAASTHGQNEQNLWEARGLWIGAANIAQQESAPARKEPSVK